MKKVFLGCFIVFAMMMILSSCYRPKPDVSDNAGADNCSHAFNEWFVLKEATCVEDGERARECDFCWISEKESIPKLSQTGEHTFENCVCLVCGENTYSKGLEYGSYYDGTCYVSGIGTCTDTNVVIPSTYEGLKVVAIGGRAFYKCDSIRSVVIGENVSSIKKEAFGFCDSLVSIEIPNSMVLIEDAAFYGCYKLKEIINKSRMEITVGSDNHGNIAEYAIDVHRGESKIVNQDDFLFYVDKPSENGYQSGSGTNYLIGYFEEESEVVLPKSFADNQAYEQTYEIASYAFCNNDSFTSLIIPDSVTKIGANAFADCVSLTSVEIGDRVSSIGSGAFIRCYSLANIRIGSNVKRINDYAFGYCESITSILIPENITFLNDDSFYGCGRLIEVINKSSLDITAGSETHGYVAYYAKEVHSGESKLVNQDGFVFYSFEGTNYLMNYVGEETELILPDKYNGQNYEIYNGAFSNCNTITSVKLGSGVTSIGEEAFFNCDSLVSVEFGNGLTKIGRMAFAYCSSLMRVVIPDGITNIEYRTFGDCESLRSVVIPASVTNIDKYAFDDCEKIIEVVNNSSLNITAGSTDYGYVARYAIEVHSGESKLVNQDGCLFYSTDSNCYLIKYIGDATQVVLPDKYNDQNYEIYSKAFEGFAITSIKLGSGVTSIGNYAFYDCIALTSIVIPDNVTNIGEIAFSGCKSLASVEIGKGVTDIGNYAFYDCIALTSIVIPDNVTNIGGSAFSGCKSLSSVEIGKGVTKIGEYAFAGCESLTSIVIPYNVSDIGEGAFWSCILLTDVYYAGTSGRWSVICKGYEKYTFTVHDNYYISNP